MRLPGKTILLLMLAATLTGCTPSLHLANRFVVEKTDIPVLVLPPERIIKSYATGHPDSVPPDSVHGPDDPRARFVSQLDDSLFISQFMESMGHHFDRLYLDLYGPETIDSFFALEEPAYVFVLAQMEVFEYREEEVFRGRSRMDEFIGRVDVTVLENNVWFEFYKVHDPGFDMEVLFSAHATSDHVEARFIRLSDGRVAFDPTRYPLAEGDMYDLAWFSGKQNAHRIFDHLLNAYVRTGLGRDPDTYYHYDVETHSIRERDHPPFLRVDPGGGQ